jgi:hypothetical protein
MEELSIFELEGKCVVLYDNDNGVNTFFTDGFNLLQTFEELNSIYPIKIKEVFIERGEGTSYFVLNTDILRKCVSISELTNHLKDLPNDIFIHKMEIQSSELLISIYDNREFTIKTNKSKEFVRPILLKLFSTCFKFSPVTSEYILDKISLSPGFYFSINDLGSITGKYKDIEECYE